MDVLESKGRAIETVGANALLRQSYSFGDSIQRVEFQSINSNALADNLHHSGILRRGAVHVAVQVLVAVSLQLLNHATGDEFQLRLGSREIEETATVEQRRTADADMPEWWRLSASALELIL